jgi:hypothetical protein
MHESLILATENFLEENNIEKSMESVFAYDMLKKCGYDDDFFFCVCMLHKKAKNIKDIEKIKKVFGFEIAHAIFVLDRKTLDKGVINCMENSFSKKSMINYREAYRFRLSFANKAIQRVKLAFLLYSLKNLEKLPPVSCKVKIAESQNFYIPLSKKIWPKIEKLISKNIKEYEKKLIENFFLHNSSI